MPNTPNLALPYPAATDPVAEGAAAMQALAETLDTYLDQPRYLERSTNQVQGGVNSTAEETLWTYVLPAGSVAIDQSVRLLLRGVARWQTTGATGGFTFRLKANGAEICQVGKGDFSVNDPSQISWALAAELSMMGALNAQMLAAGGHINRGNPTPFVIGYSFPTINFAADVTFTLTGQPTSANNNNYMQKRYTFVELV